MCIKMRWNIISLVMVLLLTMTGCRTEKSNNVLSQISKAIGVGVFAGVVIYELDSHGGFHGDGTTIVEIQFADASFSEQIKDNEEWNALPLTENLTALVYGIQTEELSVGPMIHREDNIPAVPEIENGYYYFRDRHYESTDPKDDSGVLGRGSYNFTIAILDTIMQRLYYLEFDT